MNSKELKDKIQERLNVHNCTGRCTDYIIELHEKAVEEAKRDERILSLATHRKDRHLWYDADEVHKALSEPVKQKCHCHCHCHYDCNGMRIDPKLGQCKCLQVHCEHCQSQKL